MIFGYRESEVLGADVRELIPAAFRESDAESPSVFVASRETKGKKKDGSNLYLDITVCGLLDGKKLIRAKDITERKKYENELLLFKRLFESLSEGVIVVDNRGVIIFANPASAALTGRAPGEVCGLHYSEIKVPLAEPGCYGEVINALRRFGHWSGEVVLKLPGGKRGVFWASFSAVKDVEGNTLNYAAVFTDISEKARLKEEKELLAGQAARARQAATLGAASASLAHEIKQPLNAIKVMADGMIYWHRHGRCLDVAKVVDALEKISRQADRILAIVKNVRYFLSAGTRTQPVPCDLNKVVERVLDLVSPQAQQCGAKVQCCLGEGLPPVLGDKERLEEIVLNLLQNAVQAVRSCDEEILPLAEMFLRRFSAARRKRFQRISPAAAEILLSYPWPGNVRELKNTLDRVTLLWDGEEVKPSHLELPAGNDRPAAAERALPVLDPDNFDLPLGGFPLEEFTNKIIEAALKKSGGNKTLAAKYLGISRRSLYCRLKRIYREGG